MWLRVVVTCCTLHAALAAPSAHADETRDAKAGDEQARREARMSSRDYWSKDRVRPFVGAAIDVGTSARGRLMVGYGKPHWTWGGLELEAGSTSDAGILALRARLALVVADVGLAYRETWAYRRHWLVPEQGYTETDLRGSPRTRYRSLDLDVWGLIPAGSGFVQWQVEAVRLYGFRAGHELYEEWLRAPIRPPWATATRLAYAYTFWSQRASVGAMGEWLWLGGRGALFRVGPLLSYTFSPHWELNVLLTTPVHSPDRLGFFTALYGTVRVRWRFASGEQAPIYR